MIMYRNTCNKWLYNIKIICSNYCDNWEGIDDIPQIWSYWFNRWDQLSGILLKPAW